MSAVLVDVQGVSKKFCRSLRRSLWYGMQNIGSELLGRSGDKQLRTDEFWALKDVSIQIACGETVGLIGHNGAGKTTLLRMLSGLIRPDSGQIIIRGRIQALIALGAGFNPVLTGRENIYVNGSVLGIRKNEIDRRFDEIVAFSGIEEFIDMPVQSYSSGMVVRLGFSIAAHLEPDILLVDEVLAVGDLAFRTKCQVRIQELKRRGVAIILVSHSLHTISHVCTRVITLERGQVLYDGDPEQAIGAYMVSLMGNQERNVESLRGGTGEIRVSNLAVLDEDDVIQREVGIGDFVKLRIHFHASCPVENPVFNVIINDLSGQQVTGIRTDMDHVELGILDGFDHVDIVIPQFNLLPNVYSIDVAVFHRDGFTYYDRVSKIAQLQIRGAIQVNGFAYLPHWWRVDGNSDKVTATPMLSTQSSLNLESI